MGSITIAVTVVVVKILILILIVLKEKTVSLARQNALNKRRNSLCVVIWLLSRRHSPFSGKWQPLNPTQSLQFARAERAFLALAAKFQAPCDFATCSLETLGFFALPPRPFNCGFVFPLLFSSDLATWRLDFLSLFVFSFGFFFLGPTCIALDKMRILCGQNFSSFRDEFGCVVGGSVTGGKIACWKYVGKVPLDTY